MTAFLDKASKAYYGGNPIISDAQFDKLAEMTGYNKVGSNDASNTCEHYSRLYSLQKYYNDDISKQNPLHMVDDVSYSIKLDGAAISILYVDGKLTKVITRGDGIVGQDITNKFLATNIIPKTIRESGVLQITGEIVAPAAIENSRNYAAGSLNLKDINEFKTRAIVFIAYGCFPYINETYDQDMITLGRMGFRTVKEDNLIEVYPSDGVVFRVNDNTLAESMGYTSKFPKYAYALKERQDCVETTILDVEWNTGRTGRVTPVAILDPVYIGDKVVSRVTLNNPGFIEALDINIGDTVAIRLAGMIIPELVHKVDA